MQHIENDSKEGHTKENTQFVSPMKRNQKVFLYEENNHWAVFWTDPVICKKRQKRGGGRYIILPHHCCSATLFQIELQIHKYKYKYKYKHK